ncbi:MAG: hypothetical protein R3307_02880 [Anaerolineales bacterium]|nr:hypothetical protein [Anaerolineales bacterium]
MHPYSLEVLARQKQKQLLEDGLQQQSLRGKHARRRIKPVRFTLSILTVLLLYIWLFV